MKSLIALLCLAPLAKADFIPDNLDGACWAPSNVVLPDFPSVELPSLGICWSDCSSTTEESMVFLSPPIPTGCAQFMVQVSVFNAGGLPVMDGLGTLDYTRTWEEIDTAGDSHQVWRMAFKVDLRAEPPLGACYVSASLNFYDTAFYYGHVDYSRNCSTGEWEYSLSMFHNCDLFIHQQGISSTPGTFGPNEMYAIVGPHTALNPFVPADIIPPSGPLTAEAVRNTGGTTCFKEERIDNGILAMLVVGCLCPLSPLPFTQSASFFRGEGTCPDSTTGAPSSFGSLFFPGAWPTIPWIHMNGTSLGNWTTAASYPGPEQLWANEGLFTFHDSCVAEAGDPADFLETYYGVTTREGWDVIPFDSDLTQTFVDLASNYSLNLADPPVLPLVGNVMPTRHLIYTNVP